MSAFSAGVTLALTTGYETHHRWREYWAIIQPWGWIYAGFTVLDVAVYPEGNPSRLMTVLWMLLYLGLSLIMWWNWLLQLNKRPGRISWQGGWDNSDFRHFVSSMAFAILVLPLVLAFAVALPLGLLLAVFGVAGSPVGSAFQYLGLMLVMGVALYCIARLAVLPSVLLSGQVPALPTAWQFSARNWQTPVSALAVIFISNLTLFFLLAALFNLLQGLSVPRPSLWLLPISLSVSFFTLGWLITLGQRLYDYLRGGPYAHPSHQ